ncbi:hypothetical protein KMP13_10875 [Epibacterium ulvae]|uniref:hypothetical protein n=1 Tax=Epibacterium ulvae TaxID=1156985 RepID=UPI001BFCBC28|nr:hypothetical protein [Epibacterium ulvae]MBT8154392.1 hypothetical protein [Epibacterium ulvae]
MAHLKPASFLCLLTLVTVGCGPVAVYHKDRTSFATLEQDLLACEVQALRDAPVANEIRQDPPVFHPGRRICRKDGSCYHTGGFWREGRIYTVDTNEGLRGRLAQSCMIRNDYTQIEAQRCPPGTVRPPKDALGRLVTPASDTCAISVKNGPRVLRPAP